MVIYTYIKSIKVFYSINAISPQYSAHATDNEQITIAL